MAVSSLLQRIQSQRGFTLIEVLVVTLIIGALAAIAIPAFIGQRDLASDAEAKSNARGLVTQVEACFTTSRDYSQCDSAADISPDFGLPIGPGPGKVSVVEADETTYAIEAVSMSSDGGVNRVFRIEHEAGKPSTRSCSPDGAGCKSGSW